MSEQVVEEVDDLGQPGPDGELVHWMDPKPLRVGPAGVSATAAGAFVLGVATTLAVLALTHWLGPERVLQRPRWRTPA
ncbi:MAG: hypothetical protein JWR47_1697 [Phenylobacterium sp.]|jgi:hypothetical protein|uniref:hypothetical protein n=1 Tax=Phenylobacterium sp. TaxID=1871053 RepID=UPI00260CE147|nr:hypothetical protein [Phenylobacterium sp.]MDB5435440.1 hypothetical protein [Phenylobacterium sp.]MDB5499800.1 hypothetical protein [Phenylobacterium sp.]